MTRMRVLLGLSGSSTISISRSFALAFSISLPSLFSVGPSWIPMRLSALIEAVLTRGMGAVNVR